MKAAVIAQKLSAAFEKNANASTADQYIKPFSFVVTDHDNGECWFVKSGVFGLVKITPVKIESWNSPVYGIQTLQTPIDFKSSLLGDRKNAMCPTVTEENIAKFRQLIKYNTIVSIGSKKAVTRRWYVKVKQLRGK